jgi:hypothetical protein
MPRANSVPLLTCMIRMICFEKPAVKMSRGDENRASLQSPSEDRLEAAAPRFVGHSVVFHGRVRPEPIHPISSAGYGDAEMAEFATNSGVATLSNCFECLADTGQNPASSGKSTESRPTSARDPLAVRTRWLHRPRPRRRARFRGPHPSAGINQPKHPRKNSQEKAGKEGKTVPLSNHQMGKPCLPA